MTKAVARQKQSAAPVTAESLSKVLLHGDLSALKPEEKVVYYNKVCEIVGLNPLTKPFDYIKLSGKDVLYASKGCAEQLRELHGVSLAIKEARVVGDIYLVVVDASMPSGRKDVGTGAVAIKGLAGEALANAFMKCETKAKRRATLSICGLNMLDETEVASIPDAAPATPASPSAQQSAVKPAAQTVAAPKQSPGSRAAVADDIVALKNTLKLSNQEIADWAFNSTGKATKEMSLAEMIAFRDELKNKAEASPR